MAAAAEQSPRFSINKISGMLHAVCLGDALGLPYEFKYNTAPPYNGSLIGRSLNRPSRNGPRVIFEPAQISDDGEMTIILATHILRHNTVIPDQLTTEYMEWAPHPTSCCMGRNTRILFAGIKTLRGHATRRAKMDPNNQSNGHLMRASPLVMLNAQQWSIECAITNPHPVCIEAQNIYLTMMRSSVLIDTRVSIDKREIAQAAIDSCISSEHQCLRDCGLNAQNGTDRNIKTTPGWTVHALYCAIYCMMNFNTFASAMEWIIEKGGDTDTTGAIALGVLGAYYGFAELIAEQPENMGLLMQCTTENSTNPRPEHYRVSHLRSILPTSS